MQELLVICIVVAAVIYLVRRYKPILTSGKSKNCDGTSHDGGAQGCSSCCGCSCQGLPPDDDHCE